MTTTLICLGRACIGRKCCSHEPIEPELILDTKIQVKVAYDTMKNNDSAISYLKDFQSSNYRYSPKLNE